MHLEWFWNRCILGRNFSCFSIDKVLQYRCLFIHIKVIYVSIKIYASCNSCTYTNTYTQLHTHACTVSKLSHLKKLRCGLIISNKIKFVKDQNLPRKITIPRHPGPPKLRFGMTGPPKIYRSNTVHLRRYDCMSRVYQLACWSPQKVVAPKGWFFFENAPRG